MEKTYFREKDQINYTSYDEFDKTMNQERQEILLSQLESEKNPLKTYIYWMVGIDIFLLMVFSEWDIGLIIVILIVIPLQYFLCPKEYIEGAKLKKSTRDFWGEIRELEKEVIYVKKIFNIELSRSEENLAWNLKWENYNQFNNVNSINNLPRNKRPTVYTSNYNSKNDVFKSMTGLEFEKFVENLLIKIGYREVKLTSRLGTSHTYKGDGGIDLTAIDLLGRKVAIQCKNTGLVSNDIISRTHGAKDLSKYKCDYALIITSGKYTVPAIIEAKDLGVELWDGEKLKILIK